MEAKLNAVGVKSLLSSLSPLLALVVVALIGRSFGLGEYLSLGEARRQLSDACARARGGLVARPIKDARWHALTRLAGARPGPGVALRLLDSQIR